MYYLKIKTESSLLLFRLQWAGFSIFVAGKWLEKWTGWRFSRLGRIFLTAEAQSESFDRRSEHQFASISSVRQVCLRHQKLRTGTSLVPCGTGNWTETGKGIFKLLPSLSFTLGKVYRVITQNRECHWVFMLASRKCQKVKPKLWLHSVCPLYLHPCLLSFGFGVYLMSVDMSGTSQFSTDFLDLHLQHVKQF